MGRNRLNGKESSKLALCACLLQRNPCLPSLQAVKKVMMDRRYQNRELDMIKSFDHSNVVTFVDSHESQENVSV